MTTTKLGLKKSKDHLKLLQIKATKFGFWIIYKVFSCNIDNCSYDQKSQNGMR